MPPLAFFLVVVLCFAVSSMPGQAPAAPAFEVASIKRSQPDANWRYELGPGGKATLTGFRVRDMILLAWHIQDFRLTGEPAWADTEHYDVQAKAEGNPSEDELRLMLRSMLAERFQLKLRTESRRLPIFRLMQAQRGTKMTAANPGGCTPLEEYSGPQPPPETYQPPICGFRQRLRPQNQGAAMMQIQATGVTLKWFARTLATILDRQVDDETGVPGEFDFTLEYAPEQHLADRSDGPDFFTALQEQLGLKLEAGKGPVEIFVIDHVERPSAN